jgi:hypothetical protein
VTATSVTLRGQLAAEALMVDSCTIQRVTGTSTNDTTGVVTPTYSTIYTGKCKLQAVGSKGQAPARPHVVDQAQVFLFQLELHVPMSVTGVQADDVVTVTASLLDADLTTRVWRIRALSHKSFQTARRFTLEEVLS